MISATISIYWLRLTYDKKRDTYNVPTFEWTVIMHYNTSLHLISNQIGAFDQGCTNFRTQTYLPKQHRIHVNLCRDVQLLSLFFIYGTPHCSVYIYIYRAQFLLSEMYFYASEPKTCFIIHTNSSHLPPIFYVKMWNDANRLFFCVLCLKCEQIFGKDPKGHKKGTEEHL